MKLFILFACSLFLFSVANAQDTADKSNTTQTKNTHSLSDSNGPLFVIDGFIQKDSIGNRKSNPFINPDKVERVEVFKGSSATALYGEDGENGVIVITTKEFAKKTQLPKE